MKNKSNIMRILETGMLRWLAAAVVFGVAVFAFEGNTRKEFALWCIIALILLVAADVLVMFIRRKINGGRVMQTAFYHNADGRALASIKDFKLPMIFLNRTGELIWSNKPFKDLFTDEEGGKAPMRKTVSNLFSHKILERLNLGETEFTLNVDFAGKFFIMQGVTVDDYIMVYFVDITELWKIKIKADQQALAIGVLNIDSYEEIYQADGENIVNLVTGELGKMLDKWIEDKHAVVRKLVRDRYLLLIEKKYLQQIELDRFSILDDAKKISVGNRSSVTLSIGISVGEETIEDNYHVAENACRLAMERGGDQAVVRRGQKDNYYGGSNTEIERRTKIRARVIASALKEEINKSSDVLIMGHNNCDMDSLGAALSVYRLCCVSGKKASIILNGPNKSIEYAYNHLCENGYEDVFISTADALNIIGDNTLTVVVDTYKQGQTEAPKVLDYSSRIAVIDHHRRGADYIKDTVLFYSETYASSTCELMVEIIGYYAGSTSIPKNEAEAMYAGICIDTKNFSFKTGIRTFEAASYLRSQGVDTVEVKKYIEPDYETYTAISNAISSSKLLDNGIAIAKYENETSDAQFVASLAADRLLTIAGIEASFVLYYSRGGVGISGRSLGNVNVQVILEKLGGGGHFIAAGAQIKDTTIDKVETMLKEAIAEVTK